MEVDASVSFGSCGDAEVGDGEDDEDIGEEDGEDIGEEDGEGGGVL